MPAMWFSLKKSLHCKSEPSDVHDPKSRKQLSAISTKRGGWSGCSRSIANLKDVIHGSKRHNLERPPSNCSPRSIGSSEFLNPITHQVILSKSKCELKITGFGGFQEGFGGGCGSDGGDDSVGVGSNFVGTLRPGIPGPGEQSTIHCFNNPSSKASTTPPRKSPFLLSDKEGSNLHGIGVHSSHRLSLETDSNNNGSSTFTCHKCGEHFNKREAAETHHLSKHAGKKIVSLILIYCFSSFMFFIVK